MTFTLTRHQPPVQPAHQAPALHGRSFAQLSADVAVSSGNGLLGSGSPGRASSRAAAVPVALGRQSPPAATCVIVDDSPSVRELIGFQLLRSGAGRIVGEAENGRQAIDVAAATQPDIIFLDQRMPVMDGLTALPTLRRATPRSRVVMFSSGDSRELARHAIEAGAAAYVEKSLRTDFGRLVADVMGT